MTPEEKEIKRRKKWAAADFNTRRHMYLRNGGAYCYFCGSPDIQAGPMEMDGAAWCEVTCQEKACGKTFRDVYKLIDVESDFDERSENPPV